ncbi:MAG: superoxide reductase [Gammaproteobacteria bacterium]|jgi:superoxide reductase
MNRRSFIRLSALAAATGIIAPTTVLASRASMAGGIYYTKDAPGRWSKKVAGHLPNIEVSGKTIQIVTGHEMKGYEHYIIKHIVLNDEFEFIDEKMFDPMKDKAPISQFDLGGYSGRIHVLSVCNVHDSWLNIAEV